MADSGNKTVPTGADVSAYLAGLPDDRQRADAGRLAELMAAATGAPPVLWGASIVGFGSWHYRYASGREGDTAAVAFAPRKGQLTLYLTGSLDDYADLLERLGPHTAGKGCLHLKRLDGVDLDTLRAVVARSHAAASR
ncbi:DUF1801 domain-containing protein [Motilibacter deserti]|uniref:DUF1801 domain-containing protein n=1 Tax=Motilibacter deserti TaxID=2714956 RepID=A0ABX0GP61_9ACTN|nr:DUF1801 domain-containing protein [Motilibacter deserti]NHC12619.1 DUF1801 domain-containing protein [Motilibacter deserti]